MLHTIIAIDPGASGGIAWQHPQSLPACLSMPDTEGDILAELKVILAAAEGQGTVCFLEEVTGFIPGRPQPASRMFNFGRNFGFLLGTLQTLGCRVELVRPQIWQKALSLHRPKEMKDNLWKNKLKARAQQLYPQCKVTLQTADALLLLDFAQKRLGFEG